jgi:integrase
LELEKALAGVPVEDTRKRIQNRQGSAEGYRQGYGLTHREKSVAWVAERTAHVERLVGASLLPDLTEDRIREYIRTRMAEGAGNRTINMELLCLSRAIGRTWRELWRNVPKLEEREDIGRALSPEEEAAILDAAAANRSPVIDRFIRIALVSVMRSGEIRTLQVGRVNFRDRTVRVGRSKSKNDDLLENLSRQLAWLEEKFGPAQPDWYLFPFFGSARRPSDPTRPTTTIKSAWESVRAAAGVRCRFHDLRHTAITKLAEQGVPVQQ